MSGSIDSISDVKNRGEMIRFFETAMNTSAQSLKEEQKLIAGTNLAKSFIIETHLRSPENLLQTKSKIQLQIKETEDRDLRNVSISFKDKRKEIGKFILDSKDSRFWVFHTLERSTLSKRLIRHLVESSMSKLDNIWLSREFLTDFIEDKPMSEFSAGFETDIPESLSDQDYISKMSVRVWGTASRKALRALRDSHLRNTIALRAVRARFIVGEEQDQLYADERLTHNGVLSASGTSANIHVQTVSNVIKKYERIIIEIEKSVRKTKFVQDIQPQYLKVLGKISDVKKFVELLYANMHRLRIFGVPSKVSTNYYRIPAIDLHNGDKLDLEIYPEGIRIVLWPDACGNTILRLENRLQKFVNADIVRSVADES